ncbi:hypothetical protein [Arsenicicoccus dermatophilus]|uniref:hypothetical protein n=1 Tax=Arsenicicoccus dermatophilus TaxID=1076331 RepID=UPI001F4C5788|nr:hypothetical protein [Arsenicicoccus dermatophilus]MCH8611644.1 hypothetical protein [Arsenicicoccus dermatophilus]
MGTQQTRRAPLLGIAMSVTLCVGVPFMLTLNTAVPTWSPIPWPAVGVMVVSGARYAWLVASSRRHLYEMVLWLFTYVFMGYAPFVQQRLGGDIDTTPRLDPRYVGAAWTLVYLGIGAALIGSSCARAVPLRERNHLPHVSPARTTFLTGFSLLLAIYYVSKVGAANLFLNRYAYAEVLKRAFPDQVMAALVAGWASMGMLVALIAQIQLVRSNRQGKLWRWQLAAAILTGLVVAVIVNPFSNPRFMVGTVLMAALASLGVYATPRRYRLVAVVALLGLVFVFPLLNVFRGSNPTTGNSNVLSAMQSGDFDAFAQIVNTLDYVDHRGSTNGRQLAGVLMFWVPRSLWPDKPVDTGILLANYKSYGFDNLSAPLWSELYINAEIAGVILGFLVVGFFTRLLDRVHELELQHHPAPAIAGCVFPFYSLLLIRGSLLQAASVFTVAAVAILIVSFRVPEPLRRLVTAPPRRTTGSAGKREASPSHSRPLTTRAAHAAPVAAAQKPLRRSHG